jgi:uncharacterized phiE125 gp8 family phage protein
MKFTYGAQPTGTDIISLDDMKEFLRIETLATDEETTIIALLDAAVQTIQDYTGLHFKTDTWLYSMEYVQNVTIPYGVTTVGGITYYHVGGEGSTTALTNETDYYWGLYKGVLRVKFINPPSNVLEHKMDAINIVGTVVNQINAPLTHAIKMLVAHYYENRRAVITTTSSKIPLGIEAIINPYRLIHLR